ncbi:MAG TPA: hypothetical protein VHY79_16325 [Rhizomicrobium sp.]|jgi:hypothetical protein|nr:hypothetical protein [Rhizomicrobium sp.]
MGIVLRFVSLILLVIALILLGADAVTSLARGGQITVHSIDQVWTYLARASITNFKVWLAHTLPSPLPGWFYSVLALPAWALSGVLGVVLAFLFGRHAPERT